MYALSGNCHFCPAAPIRRAPAGILSLLHNSCGPNSDKTTSKKCFGSLVLGTLARDLKSPVQPPSLVQLPIYLAYFTGRGKYESLEYSYAYCTITSSAYCTSTSTFHSFSNYKVRVRVRVPSTVRVQPANLYSRQVRVPELLSPTRCWTMLDLSDS